MSAMSIPGAMNPVHETETTWVMSLATLPASAIAFCAAAIARGGAWATYAAIRSAVVGPRPHASVG
jgi:hypothetical protein